MRLVLTIGIVILLVSCVSAPPRGHPPALAGPLALHSEAGGPAEIGLAFAREVSSRFGGERRAQDLRDTLIAQGFQCTDVDGAQGVRVGEMYATCDLPTPHGLCLDRWVVEMRLTQLTRALDFVPVRPEGRFERSCTSGASPN